MKLKKISIQLALAAFFVAGAAAAEIDERESYSYLAVIDGAVTVAAPGEGPGERAETNQPLLVGDEVRLPRGSRGEVILADRNILRLDGDTVLTLSRVAYSADREDRTTLLDLAEGELLLIVGDDALGDELPEIRTPGATVYVQQPGTYRIEADASGYTEVVVREGYAELLTDQGSSVVRAGEAGTVSGDRFGRVEVYDAGPEDGLERWGRERYENYARTQRGETYVDSSLAYAAAPLYDHGSWIHYDSSWYWRPRVAAGWRPYWDGRWCPTPSGLTWVSYEPWGWVPYHYGTWSILGGHGWVWSPGYVYSPAWVYWSWGDRWAGWCPVGYYTHHYRPWGFAGFRWGVYGWAGGGWDLYTDWNFVPTWCVRERDWRRHHRTGHDLRRTGGSPPHGVITVDTHDITRERLRKPGEIPELLAEAGRRANGTAVPDVTDFVARKRDLPETVATAIREPKGRTRLAGTPLAPDTPGKSGRGPVSDDPKGGSTRSAYDTRGDEKGDDKRRVIDGRRDSPAGRPDIASPSARSRGVVEDEKPRQRQGAGRDVDTTPAPRPRSGAVDEPGDRQGWRKSGGDIDSPRGVPRSREIESPRGGGSPGGKDFDREEPVRRVVGGVRGRGADESPAPRGRVEAPAPRTGKESQPSTSTATPGQRWKQEPRPSAPTPRGSSDSGSRTRSAPQPRAQQPARPEKRDDTPPPAQRPSYSRSAERPSYAEPRSQRPSSSQPSYSRPRAAEPSYSRPRAAEPGSSRSPERPSYSQPRSPRPSYSEPRSQRPSASQPSYSRPRASEPSYSRPRASEPSYSRPRASEPSYSRPKASQPSYSQPRSQQPSYSSPGSQQRPSYSAPSGSSSRRESGSKSSPRSGDGKSSGSSSRSKHGKG